MVAAIQCLGQDRTVGRASLDQPVTAPVLAACRAVLGEVVDTDDAVATREQLTGQVPADQAL